MFKRLGIICLSILLQGCISTAVTGVNAIYNHNTIEKSISDYYLSLHAKHSLLADPKLSGCNLSVTMFKRLALLTGQAHTQQQRAHAVKVLQKIPEIMRIYNAIVVGKTTTFSTETSDSWITTKIKTKLFASHKLNPDDVKVVTEKRIVYLMGVLTHEQAAAAMEIATNTSGVKKVVKIFYYITISSQ